MLAGELPPLSALAGFFHRAGRGPWGVAISIALADLTMTIFCMRGCVEKRVPLARSRPPSPLQKLSCLLTVMYPRGAPSPLGCRSGAAAALCRLPKSRLPKMAPKVALGPPRHGRRPGRERLLGLSRAKHGHHAAPRDGSARVARLNGVRSRFRGRRCGRLPIPTLPGAREERVTEREIAPCAPFCLCVLGLCSSF